MVGNGSYGQPRALANNITHIYDGNGDLYLENEYGTDPTLPSFDAVVRQRNGDGWVQLGFRDLVGEQHDDLPTAGVSPSLPEVVPGSVPNADLAALALSHDVLERAPICDTPRCAALSQPSNAETFVPWGSTLVNFGGTNHGFARRYYLSGPSDSAPPDGISFNVMVLDASRTTARNVASGEGGVIVSALSRMAGTEIWRGAAMALGSADAIAGIVVGPSLPPAGGFDPGAPGSPTPIVPHALELRDAGGLVAKAWLGRDGSYRFDKASPVGDTVMTWIRDNGGVVRVFTGYPRAILHLADGTCAKPFVAQIDSAGALRGPLGACSDTLVVSPLASRVGNQAIVGRYRDALAQSPLAAYRALASESAALTTILTPSRYAVRWEKRGVGPRGTPNDPGTVADTDFAYLGWPAAGQGAAPATQHAALVDVATRAQVLRRPQPGFDAARPLFAFHWPRPADEGDLVWTAPVALDSSAGFSAALGPAAACTDQSPEVRAAYERATVVRDVYGAVWTYYWDRHGRLLRKENLDTGSLRGFRYDARGGAVGARDAMGSRTCAGFDADGDVVAVTRYGAPTERELEYAPIVQRFTYVAATASAPKRLARVSDPRAPARAMASYEYDERGNLTLARDALGYDTTYVPSRFGSPASVTDPSGSVTRLDYADTGLVRRAVRDADGPQPQTTSISYTSAGLVAQRTSATGMVTRYDYEPGTARLRQVSTTDGEILDASVVYGYDDDGQLTSVSDGQQVTAIAYDVTGSPRCSRTAALDGSVGTVSSASFYGPDGRLLGSVGADGTRFEYLHDGEGRAVSMRMAGVMTGDPCAASMPALWELSPFAESFPAMWKASYDLDGRLARRVDGRGVATVLRYDAHGRTSAVLAGLDAQGNPSLVQRFGYDALGNVVWSDAYEAVLAPLSRRDGWRGEPSPSVPPGLLAASAFAYDEAGQLTLSSSLHFDDARRLLSGDGVVSTRFEYDHANRRVTQRRDDGVGPVRTTIAVTDGLGRPVETLLPGGIRVGISYADAGRSITRTVSPTPSGTRTEVTRLTAFGAVRNISTADTGAVVVLGETDFDRFGRPTSSVTASGAATATEYDAFGRVERLFRWLDDDDRPSETVALDYDTASRVVQRDSYARRGTSTVRGTVGYEYDWLGRLQIRTLADGSKQYYGYAGNTALVDFYADPRLVQTSFEYDPLGNVSLQATRADGSSAIEQRRFSHDALGRLIHAGTDSVVTPQHNADIYMAWDSLGNRVGEYHSMLGIEHGVRHTPDGAGRRVASAMAGERVARSFDALGRLEALTLGGRSTPDFHWSYAGLGGPTALGRASGVVSRYEYDRLGRLVGLEDGRGAATLARWDYGIGIDGIPRTATFSGDQRATVSSVFQVDPGGRLSAENHGLAGAFGPLGPATSWAAANAAVAASVSLGEQWRSYELDGRANWMSRDAFDPALAIAPGLDAVDAYTTLAGDVAAYDDAGALTSHAGDQYDYDVFGQLVWAATDRGGRAYVYDALGRIVREEDIDTGELTYYGYDGAQRVVRARGGDIDVTVQAGLDGHLLTLRADGGRDYLHQDRTGSVYLVTDELGRPAEWYRYTAYGERDIVGPDLAPLSASAIGNRFGFQGHPHDPVTGLVDMRARFYKPTWGRFLDRDPIGYAGGPNLYAFVNSAPLAFSDPFGLSPKDAGGGGCQSWQWSCGFQRDYPDLQGVGAVAGPRTDGIFTSTGVRVPTYEGSFLTPRARYSRNSAAFAAYQGYIHYAELLEAGHDAAASQVSDGYATATGQRAIRRPMVPDDQLDLDGYAGWSARARSNADGAILAGGFAVGAGASRSLAAQERALAAGDSLSTAGAAPAGGGLEAEIDAAFASERVRSGTMVQFSDEGGALAGSGPKQGTGAIWYHDNVRIPRAGPGGASVELRTHAPNPNAPPGSFSQSNYTTQINTTNGLYRLPDGTWKTLGSMTPAERTAAHIPAGN